VQQLGENSPMVIFEQGNASVIMDLDAFDYTYGDGDGPDPAQRDLDALWPRVTRVCVLEGAMFRGRALSGRVLIDTRDAGAIRELASCLRIVEDASTFGHCACLGGPTMELYAGPEHLATIGLQHGQAIRWKQWYHDAQLQAGDRLTHWLHDQGIDPPRLEAIYQRGNNFLFGESSASSPRQQEARELCSRAQERAQAGKLGEALQLCTQALGFDPDEPDGYALRGQIHYHLGHLPEAAADCSAAIDRGHRHAEAYFIRAVALDTGGRMEDAHADCSRALDFDPEHVGAWNSRGLIRGRSGRLEEALGDFSEAIRLAPDWFLPRLNRAQFQHSRGQLELALSDYDKAVALLKAAAPGRAPEGDPTLALVYCRRGDARKDQSREAEAEADFAEASRQNPGAAAEYLGEMWLRRSNPDRALEAYSRLVRLHPQNPQGYIGRGMAQEMQGDLEQAAADYSTAIRLQPEGGAGSAMRARVRHRQGRFDDALADFSEDLRQHPEDAMTYLFRSNLHKERKAWAEALDDLQAAHRAAPDNPLVGNNLAWMLATCSDAQFRDGSRALALARETCQATGWNNPNCLDTLAAACGETGAFNDAIRWQTQAVSLSSEEVKSSREARLRLYQAHQPYRE
jgi:tetratricopeptide (TPR) repeat protein